MLATLAVALFAQMAGPADIVLNISPELRRAAAMPQLRTVHVVTNGATGDGHYVLHMVMRQDAAGLYIDAQLSPPMQRPLTVYCVTTGCVHVPPDQDEIRKLFLRALDETIFSDNHGLGYLIVTGCTQAPGDCATLTVQRSAALGLEMFFYNLRILDKATNRFRGRSYYYLQLTSDGIIDDTSGRFRPVGTSALAHQLLQYLMKSCTEHSASFALMPQFQPPPLREGALAANASSY